MPISVPEIDDTLLKQSEKLASEWISLNITQKSHQIFSYDFNSLLTVQKLEFFDKLLEEEKLSHDKLSLMDKLYQLSKAGFATVLINTNKPACGITCMRHTRNISKDF